MYVRNMVRCSFYRPTCWLVYPRSGSWRHLKMHISLKIYIPERGFDIIDNEKKYSQVVYFVIIPNYRVNHLQSDYGFVTIIS